MIRSTLELLLASVLWGFGFIATVWALESFSAPMIIAARFIIAFGLSALTFIVLWSTFKDRFDREEFKLSFIPGALLAALLLLQTVGLEYTTATKSAFLTCLYAVMTPVAITIMGKVNFHLSLWLWAALALLGVGFIVEFEVAGFNFGDMLTVGCALGATFHFLVIGNIAHKIHHPFVFNVYQSFWAGVVALTVLPFWHSKAIQWPITGKANLGLLALAVLSTFIAFAIQIRAQKKLSETHVSLLCLLESPFALVFALFFLAEEPSGYQLIGCALIFISAAAATFYEAKKHKVKISQTHALYASSDQ